ncbi:MAG: hypothetical protein WD690_04010 [Vicinamibacterales bacterium]
MHAFDDGEKNPRVRVLYACRTVPHAKVGRHSLDDGVQRRIEQAYPALQFDWPKLLKEAAASAPRPERTDPRATEPRGKQRRERKPRTQTSQVPWVPSVPQVPQVPFAEPAVPEVLVQEVQTPEPVERDGMSAEPETIETPEPLEPITEPVDWTPLDEPEEPEPEEPAEPGTEPGEPMEPREPVEPLQVPEVHVGPLLVDRAWPVVGLIGPDRALILRGRYIELAHRILSRISSPADRARLVREAARLNPENWKTDEDARAGVAAFEEAHGRLAEQLRRQPPV